MPLTRAVTQCPTLIHSDPPAVVIGAAGLSSLDRRFALRQAEMTLVQGSKLLSLLRNQLCTYRNTPATLVLWISIVLWCGHAAVFQLHQMMFIFGCDGFRD